MQNSVFQLNSLVQNDLALSIPSLYSLIKYLPPKQLSLSNKEEGSEFEKQKSSVIIHSILQWVYTSL